MKNFITPNSISGETIKRIRKQLQLTQKEFAGLVNISVPTIERWEISDKEITGPIVLVTLLLARNNGIIDEFLIPEEELVEELD